MRNLLEISANTDTIVDLADWVEISAFFQDDKSVSQEDLVRSLVREGNDRAEAKSREKAAAAFEELSNRVASVGNDIGDYPHAAYPFEIDGDLLKLSSNPFDGKHSGLVYSFLLAITRASMESKTRSHQSIDPTQLFEELCAGTLCQFWGGRSPLSDVFVTGTSNRTVDVGKKRFPSLINMLSQQLGEGGGFKPYAISPGAGDGGLDLAVWRKFQDKRPGGLVGFAQCKTGDHWRNHLGRNNPRSICQKFFKNRFVLSPLPIYMVPCRVSLEEWEHVMEQHTGILFDRCRIASFGTHLPDPVLTKCESWLKSVIDLELDSLVARGLRPKRASA